MIKILDGRSSFWQWDVNQKLVLGNISKTTQVHIWKLTMDTALVLKPYDLDGNMVVDVPNELLEHATAIMVYLYEVEDGGEKRTTRKAEFEVKARAKPNDYITDVDMLDRFLARTVTQINSNVQTVGSYACYQLGNLETVTLPKATDIGTYAFASCSALTTMNAPNVQSIGMNAFYNATKLESIYMPEVAFISSLGFGYCSALKAADFPKLERIGNQGFKDSGLTTLILRNEKVVSLAGGMHHFFNTPLKYIYVPAKLIDAYIVDTYWKSYQNRFRAIEDYPDICNTEQ